MKLIKYYLAFFALVLCFITNAQYMPIEIIYNNQEYNNSDTLNIVIINKVNASYHITVGVEKYTEFGLWEEITDNILLNKLEIEGKAKGGLSYYLTPLGRVKINRVINQINIPILIIPDETKYEPMKKYRLSAAKTTMPDKIMLGTFRLSIKITDDKNQNNYMVIKSNSFKIKN